MKTWEMIKELTENPDKKFRYKISHNDGYVTVSEGTVVWRGESQGGQPLKIFLADNGTDWEEVKQPVTWQEAIEAWINNKSFSIEVDGRVYIQKPFNKLGYLSIKGKTDTFNGIEFGMIKHGKWYIED